MSVLPVGMGDSGGYQIPRSLRLRESATAQLSRAPSTTTNRRMYTVSAWVKRGSLAAYCPLISAGASSISNGYSTVGLNANGSAYVVFYSTSSHVYESAALFRDPSAWYHIVFVVDTAQATAADRLKMYVNGVQVSLTVTATYSAVPQNFDCSVNVSGASHNIGALRSSGGSLTAYFDGYLTEYRFIDGQALTPSSFGETSATTGQWQAKKYTGTYGTNGFYLPFSDTTSTTTLCYDASGNANHWTPTNISLTAGATYDSMTDVPLGGGGSLGNGQGNYATLNPIFRGSSLLTYSAANLTFSYSAPTTPNKARVYTCGSIGVSAGQWYYEFTPASPANDAPGITSGIFETTADPDYVNYVNYFPGGTFQNSGGSVPTAGASYTSGDVIGVAFDLDARTVQFFKQGVSQGTVTGITAGLTWFPGTRINTAASGGSGTYNFGQRPFAYPPPTGFKALHTGNLPTPAITKAKNHFDVITDTGANIKAAVEALYSDQALMVVKDRANVNNWQWFNDVTGLNAILQSNTTSAETTYSTPSGSSVGYGWKAGNGTVSNTQGTITSTVSANPTAGFSIVTRTGTGVAGTVGHGLNVVPAFRITKSRGVAAWVAYHQALGTGKVMVLNGTNAVQTLTNYWDSAPTSSVMQTGNNADVNANGVNYVDCVFSEIAGYSKFGSYTGNGSADGPFVYCGFRPKCVFIKRTDGAGNWYIYDSVRDAYNAISKDIYPNLSNAESENYPTVTLDTLSNGFKFRRAGVDQNASGGTYIFAAFAESPFQSALAR